MMRLSLVISALDRLSGPVRKMGGNIDGMATRSGAAAGRLSSRFDKIGGAARRVAAPIAGVGAAIDRMAARGSAALGRLDRRFNLVDRSAQGLGRAIGSAVRTGVLAAGAIGVGFATAGIASIISAGVQWEQFQVSMEGAMGSARAGRSAMSWVEDFAKTTPYDVPQVMEAFIRAKNFGIDPMNGSLRTLGDTAGAIGAPIMQAVDMLADAQRFEFERSKEFGITGSTKGALVGLTYIDKQGREVTKSVKRSSLAVQNAILEILGSKFAGGMARQSKTVAGKWSNLMEFMGSASRKVWSAGVGKLIDTQLSRLLDWTDRIQGDGSLDRWAKSTGQWIERMAVKIEALASGVNWAKLAGDVGTIAGAIRDLTGAIGDMLAFGDRVQSFFARLQGLSDRWGAMGLLRQGAAAFGARTSNFAGTAQPSQIRSGWQFRKPAPSLGPPARGGRPLLYRNQASTPAQVGGRIDLRIHTDPGTKATVTGIKSVNPTVPIDVMSRGPVRKGA